MGFYAWSIKSYSIMLKEIFENNKNIVINTDIDGILAGLILVKSLGCKIVGFTNSKEYVWLTKDHDDLYGNIYVDMFVTDDRAICIDQHVVAVNDEHQKKIIASGNKYSPQIEGNRKFTEDEYKIKYPFGATHYIIAQLESEGITVVLPDINKSVPGSTLKLADLILRADDAMASTVYAYRDNALDWWKTLSNKAPGSKNIEALREYNETLRKSILDSMKKAGKKDTKKNQETFLKSAISAIKKETERYFHDEFACKSGDGGFRNITDKKGELLPNIKNYINSMADLMEVGEFDLPENFVIHEGIYHRSSWLPYFEKELLEGYKFQGHDIFSYAFIYRPSKEGEINFSFTLDMK